MGRGSKKGGKPSQDGKAGKGKGVAATQKGGGGRSKGKGKYVAGAITATGDLKESEVQLNDESRDMILGLIARLMEARGDALPCGKKKVAKRRAKSGQDEEEEDDDEADYQAVIDRAFEDEEELIDVADLPGDGGEEQWEAGEEGVDEGGDEQQVEGEERKDQGGAVGEDEAWEGGEQEEEEEEEVQAAGEEAGGAEDNGGDEYSGGDAEVEVPREAADGGKCADPLGEGKTARGTSSAAAWLGPEPESDGPEPEAVPEASAPAKSAKEAQKEEERVKRRLLRQLLNEDRREAKEAGAVIGGGEKKKPPTGPSVRLFLWNEERRHEKPKGPIAFPRDGMKACDEIIKVAKAKLSLKGGAKKQYWLYVHGGATGEDKLNKHPVPLRSTLELADDDIVVLSSKPMSQEASSRPRVVRPADAMAAHTPTRGAAGSDAGATGATAPEGHLDAVRAAYKRRAESSPWMQPRSPEEVAAQSAALQQHFKAMTEEPQWEPLRAGRMALPAAQVRSQFLKALDSAQVVVVSGETGSGKTTQCPHFILEDFSRRGRGGECTIICTQPRRLAAIGVAERVCSERGEEPGGPVGYAVRLDSRSSARTRLLFCTTGVLLQHLNEDPGLGFATHIIVDEAHERSIQTDFLLTLLRDLLPRRPQLKLVLMSATMEEGLFVDYFSQGGRQVPAVHIRGRTHSVQIRFLPEVEAVADGKPLRPEVGTHDIGPDPQEAQRAADQRAVYRDLEDWVRRTHNVDMAATKRSNRPIMSPLAEERPDYRLISDLVAAILLGYQSPDGPGTANDGSILIFMPGHMEIDRMLHQLRTHPRIGEQRAWLLPLHGQMPTHKQRLVFRRPPEGLRKVIVATNIAETSITIDDVAHVIDAGQVKENRYDPRSRMGILATCFVSQAAAKQRAGRAGRVRPGICWRLFGRGFYDQLPEYTLCEMRRTALEELVLQLRLLELGTNPGEFLRRAPEPPSAEALDAAVRTLVQIGALGPKSEGLRLTPLGFHLAHMPMDVRTGKMLLYGALMRCLGPMLTIAACLSEKSPFTRGFGGKGREEQVRFEKEAAFGHLRSDHLAAAEAFERWQDARRQGREAERSFCDRLALSSSALEAIASLRERFLRHLQEVGFVPTNSAGKGAGRRPGDSANVEALAAAGAESWDPNANSHEHALLRCVLCAGLYPNVAQIQRVSGKGGSKIFLVSVGDLDRCAVHPGSLNARRLDEMQANHGWLLYHTKVKTSQVFLHDSTLIGSIPLLLFGGGDLRLARNRKTMLVDGQLRFDGRREETAVLLKLLRKEVDRLLLLKIANPAADISKTAEPLLAAVAELLRLEGARGGGLRRAAA